MLLLGDKADRNRTGRLCIGDRFHNPFNFEAFDPLRPRLRADGATSHFDFPGRNDDQKKALMARNKSRAAHIV
jgi:hypothetical protein